MRNPSSGGIAPDHGVALGLTAGLVATAVAAAAAQGLAAWFFATVAGALGVVLAVLLARLRHRYRRAVVERDRARTTAERAALLQSDILANISHEIRTPLHGIVASTSMLQIEGDDPQQERLRDLVQASTDALVRLVDDLLDVSRLERGEMSLEVSTFSLWNSLVGFTSLMAPRARREGLELRLEISPSLPRRMRGDPARLRQVLMNLVDNAIKFSEEGVIEIQAEPLEDEGKEAWIRLAVRDRGMGIPVSMQAAVYEPFRQVDASSSKRFGGVGIGLTLAKRLVERMGGHIGVESAPGVGSTFWLEIPSVPELEPKARAPGAPATDPVD